ncbi:MAG: hypothetical protein RML37_04260 [Chitinophagales bacterium]|nr:hypothetical protein [Chitinophagales bacterium]
MHRAYPREPINHLGNVLSTVSDRRLPQYANGAFTHYEAEVALAVDYYAFGMAMSGRSDNSGGYRRGFNGQEKENEIAGVGNHNTAQFWEYDTRLRRRWNVDPKPIPSISYYAIFANNPIWFSDPDGGTLRFAGNFFFN